MNKILVIEDTEALREEISEILELEDYNVESAKDGEEGLRRAFSFLPDLIICDIMMPKENGYEVLTDVRKDYRTATTPFIFLSAKVEKEDVRRGMSIGADDYLMKPFSATELLEAVEVRLERSKLLKSKLETLRKNLSASLPHEFRTPLNVILGFSELFSDPTMEIAIEERVDFGKAIHANGQRLLRLVENYLLYARMQMLQISGDNVKFSPAAQLPETGKFIESIANDLATFYERKSDIVIEVTHSISLGISEEHLEKVVYELVDNGFKFSQTATPVTIRFSQEDDKVIFSVTNQGYGMTAEQIASIDGYMQFDRDKYEQQGSGLGLAIIKSITEMYRSEFAIESLPEESTTVKIIFPYSTS